MYELELIHKKFSFLFTAGLISAEFCTAGLVLSSN